MINCVEPNSLPTSHIRICNGCLMQHFFWLSYSDVMYCTINFNCYFLRFCYNITILCFFIKERTMLKYKTTIMQYYDDTNLLKVAIANKSLCDVANDLMALFLFSVKSQNCWEWHQCKYPVVMLACQHICFSPMHVCCELMCWCSLSTWNQIKNMVSFNFMPFLSFIGYYF